MNTSSLPSGCEMQLLPCRQTAVLAPTPADSYGIQRASDGTAPKTSGWRPTAALVARASIVHSTRSGFWPRPGKAAANLRAAQKDGLGPLGDPGPGEYEH